MGAKVTDSSPVTAVVRRFCTRSLGAASTLTAPPQWGSSPLDSSALAALSTPPSSSQLSPAGVLTHVLGTGLAFATIDLALGRLRHDPSLFSPTFELEAARNVALIGAAASVGLWIGYALLARALRLEPRAFSLAALAGPLAGLLHLEIFRNGDPGVAALDSILIGLGVLAGSYLMLARRTSRSPSGIRALPRGVLRVCAAVLSVLFALAVASPTLERLRDAGSAAARQVSAGHAIPRILLIVVDTLRADALSHAATDAPPTPVIDAFASRATRFSNARTPGAWTLPSVASLMTGTSPLVHRTVGRNSALPGVLPTLAERLADAGYRTGAIGHNHVLSPSRRLYRGFDTYDFGERRPPKARTLGLQLVTRARNQHVDPDVDAADLHARAFPWLEQHAEEDFFLWLHYYDPHLVYDPAHDLRPDGTPPEGLGFSFDYDSLTRIRSGHQVLDSPQRSWVRALYDAEVRSFDRELGRLFERLEDLGLYDDTLIVLTSDHGEEFWEHEGFEHGHTLYEEVLDVPLIIKLPRQTQGTLVATPVTLENVFPTILTLCGLGFEPDDLSATSLFAADGTALDAPSAPLVSTGNLYYQDRIAVLFDGWKYIRFFESGAEELYDLENDPREAVSLVAHASSELEEGRRRCDAALASAEAVRVRLGVGSGERGALSEAELEELQRLGYASK